MGMDISSKKSETRFSYGAWAEILETAINYGWQPMGTQAPEELDLEENWRPKDNWDGNYSTSDYQLITADDAENLANALYKALEAGEFQEGESKGIRISQLISLLYEGEVSLS